MPTPFPPADAPAFDHPFATSDIADLLCERVMAVDADFRQFGRRTRFAGRCSTVIANDNPEATAMAVREAGEGRVLLIDGRAFPQFACLGDRLGEVAARSGWAGVIVIGAVRDSAQLNELNFGVKALRTTCLRGFGTNATGQRDVPIVIGDVTVRPGDAIYADADAVILVTDG